MAAVGRMLAKVPRRGHRAGMDGYEIPEEAALASDIPPRYQRVVGVQIRGDVAFVFLLTNDRPRFEPITEFCERERGRWFSAGHISGWEGTYNDQAYGPTGETVAAAASLGYEH